jgi:hypothetical protein
VSLLTFWGFPSSLGFLPPWFPSPYNPFPSENPFSSEPFIFPHSPQFSLSLRFREKKERTSRNIFTSGVSIFCARRFFDAASDFSQSRKSKNWTTARLQGWLWHRLVKARNAPPIFRQRLAGQDVELD